MGAWKFLMDSMTKEEGDIGQGNDSGSNAENAQAAFDKLSDEEKAELLDKATK